MKNLIKNSKSVLFLILFVGSVALFALTINIRKGSAIPDQSSVYEKIRNKQDIHYLIIGDSIGRGSGAGSPKMTWFSQLERLIKKQYGINMNGEFVVQSGATAYEGLYKLEHARLNKSPNAVFIVFGENDRKYMDSSVFSKHYEQLIRKVKSSYPTAEIFTITESCLTFSDFAQAIKNVSAHYQATNIDLRPVFATSKRTIEELTKDGIHPNDIGYSYYAKTIFKTITDLVDSKVERVSLPALLLLDREYTLQLKKEYSSQSGFTLQNGHMSTTSEGNYIEYAFTGTSVGVALLRAPDGGEVNVYLDQQHIDTISTWWPLKRERYMPIAENLVNQAHIIRFETTGKLSTNNVTNRSTFNISGIITQEDK